MVGQKGVKNVGYLCARNKSTKAKKYKFKDCKNRLREENKSGYCGIHYKESPKGKMARLRVSKDQREKYATVHFDRELNDRFAAFCDVYGFAKKKKLELVVKAFLDKQNEGVDNEI